MRFVGAATGHGSEVSDLRLVGAQRLPIDEPDNRTQQEIDEHDKSRCHGGMGQITGACKNAHRRGTPKRGRCIEAAHAQPFAKDQPSAQKADSRSHLRRNASRAAVAREEVGKDDETRSSQGHQGVRSQKESSPGSRISRGSRRLLKPLCRSRLLLSPTDSRHRAASAWFSGTNSVMTCLLISNFPLIRWCDRVRTPAPTPWRTLVHPVAVPCANPYSRSWAARSGVRTPSMVQSVQQHSPNAG